MPINEQELKAIAARIAAADKDKYGLQTDGQGNVLLTQRFMDMVMALPQKFVVLADGDHYTYETPFTKANVAAMKKGGVRHIFTETNAAEKASVAEERRAEVRTFRGNSFKRGLTASDNIEAAGLIEVASDPRDKSAGPNYLPLMASLECTEKLLDIYIQETGNATGPAFNRKLQRLTQQYFSAEGADELNPNKENLYDSVMALQHPSWEVSSRIPNRSELCEKLFDLASNEPESRAHHKDISPQDLRSMKAAMALFRAEVTPLQVEISKEIIAEADAINPIVSEQVLRLSAADKKTVLEWGKDHFSNLNDLDELLGNDRTIVIVTVASPEEMQRAKSRVLEGTIADLPDYLYLPAEARRKEQVISVAEFVASQQRPAAAEKTNAIQR